MSNAGSPVALLASRVLTSVARNSPFLSAEKPIADCFSVLFSVANAETIPANVAPVPLAQQITSNGLESLHSPALEVTVDTIRPENLVTIDLQEASDTGRSNSDDITSKKQPMFDVT